MLEQLLGMPHKQLFDLKSGHRSMRACRSILAITALAAPD
jgi:hypothetical protein